MPLSVPLPIPDMGMHRYDAVDRTDVGGPHGNQDCGTALSVFDWVTDAKLERFHQLGLPLPTRGEEQAARGRIQVRIAARISVRRQER